MQLLGLGKMYFSTNPSFLPKTNRNVDLSIKKKYSVVVLQICGDSHLKSTCNGTEAMQTDEQKEARFDVSNYYRSRRRPYEKKPRCEAGVKESVIPHTRSEEPSAPQNVSWCVLGAGVPPSTC